MAFTKFVLEISVLITTLFLILTQQNTDAARRDPSDLLSLLTNKLYQHKQPLIIVIGKDAPNQNRARVDKALSSEMSGEANHLIHHLLGHDQLKKKAVLYKKRTTRPYKRDETERHRYRAMGLKEEEVLLQKDRNALRSPIVKKLLRISNNLRCNAKDECQNKCNNIFRGPRQKKCQIQCEIKYICEEEEKEKEKEEEEEKDRDDCNGNDDDSCNNSLDNPEETHMSTRGVRLSTEDKALVQHCLLDFYWIYMNASIMDSPPKDNENKAARLANESDDDISSLCSLELEVNKYLDKESSNAYNVYPGVEMNNYDFTAERQNLYSTNVIESIAHLIKSCLGVGILSMHEAYMYGGLWTSLGLTFVVGFLVSYCMWMLVKSAQKMYVRLRLPRLSYPDLAEVTIATGPLKSCRRFSKAFRYLTDVFLFLNFNGTCCVFEIIIAQTLKQVLASTTGYKLSLSYLILIITVPLVALCLIRSLKYLAPFSLVADLIVVICVLTTMYYSISVAADLSHRPAWKSMHGLFRFLGICIYNINGIGVALPIENNMRRPVYFRTVLQWGMPFVVTLVMIIGFFGYWAWGELCHSPFTIHMPSNTIFIIMQGLLAITLGVTFAVHFWVPFRIIWHYIGKYYKTKRSIWERVFRALYVFLISCLSIAFPNMGTLMSFLGNFFTAFLVFIFPAIMEAMITWNEPRKFILRISLLKNLSLVLFGLFLGGGAFYSC